MLLYLLLFASIAFASKQYAYKAIYERLHLVYFNSSYLDPNDADFSFKKYNRTTFALNVSFTLLHDLDGREIDAASRMFIFVNNAYRYTGMEYVTNACGQQKVNLFGIKTLLNKYGNLELCDIKKGHYYLRNFMPDSKYFPKSVPDYRYKLEIKAYLKSSGLRLVELHWYGKPEIVIPWNKRQQN